MNRKKFTAVFSGQDVYCRGELLRDGAQITAVFGGIECDLREAVFEQDCVIRATAVFGGVDILLPANVNVQVKSCSLFGGVSDKTLNHSADNAVTVYVEAVCLFGGVDLK